MDLESIRDAHEQERQFRNRGYTVGHFSTGEFLLSELDSIAEDRQRIAGLLDSTKVELRESVTRLGKCLTFIENVYLSSDDEDLRERAWIITQEIPEPERVVETEIPENGSTP